MKIVLIGFMCSGKSKVGKLLAQKLGWSHHDTDEVVTEAAGLAPGDIIRQKGEPAFREMERAAVKRLAAGDRCVISTGGGVPLDPGNMAALASGSALVWLKVRPETVIHRMGRVETRPMIDPSNPLESVRRRLAEREPVYARAPLSVETDQASPAEIVERILMLLPFKPS